MIVLITATVAAERKSAFHDAIKSHAPVWWHYIDRTWLVKTDYTPSQWIDWLRPTINEAEDSIFVTSIKEQEFSGWLPKKAFDWIRNNS